MKKSIKECKWLWINCITSLVEFAAESIMYIDYEYPRTEQKDGNEVLHLIF